MGHRPESVFGFGFGLNVFTGVHPWLTGSGKAIDFPAYGSTLVLP